MDNISAPTSQPYDAAEQRTCTRRTRTPPAPARPSFHRPVHEHDDDSDDHPAGYERVQHQRDHRFTRSRTPALVPSTVSPRPQPMAVIQSRTRPRSASSSVTKYVSEAAAGSGPGRVEGDASTDGDDGDGEGVSAQAPAGKATDAHPSTSSTPRRFHHPVTAGHRRPPARAAARARQRPAACLRSARTR